MSVISFASRALRKIAERFARISSQKEQGHTFKPPARAKTVVRDLDGFSSERNFLKADWCRRFMSRQRNIVPRVTPLSIYYATQSPRKRR